MNSKNNSRVGFFGSGAVNYEERIKCIIEKIVNEPFDGIAKSSDISNQLLYKSSSSTTTYPQNNILNHQAIEKLIAQIKEESKTIMVFFPSRDVACKFTEELGVEFVNNMVVDVEGAKCELVVVEFDKHFSKTDNIYIFPKF